MTEDALPPHSDGELRAAMISTSKFLFDLFAGSSCGLQETDF